MFSWIRHCVAEVCTPLSALPVLDTVHHHLLEHQRPEQSGFTPKRLTIDLVLAFPVLTERRQEFWQGLLTAYIDLCKAFDSVNRDALWRILGLLRCH